MAELDKHIFAIHISNFWNETIKVGSIKKINDPEIVHRLLKVLRVQAEQQFVFFDNLFHGTIEIAAISKKDLSIKILSFSKNSRSTLVHATKSGVKSNLLSEIIFLLPLLKKEALEEAVYSLTEIGVSQIQLVVTQKSRQRLLHEKEFQRLESIVIAAAEQSKNYVYPKLYAPVPLFELNFAKNGLYFLFDVTGESFFDIRAKNLIMDKVYLLVGPEGGLTLKELQQLENLSFQKCRLTSTILRAAQAVVVGAALFKI